MENDHIPHITVTEPEGWVGFDADDTLWDNERYFIDSYDLFARIVEPYLTDRPDPAAAAHDILIDTERRNIPSFGYGIKGATISMIEAAIQISDQAIPASELMRLVDRSKEMMLHPVEFLPGVIEALDSVAHLRLVMITKGDLRDQHRKVDESGLAERFDAIEIIHEKDRESYAAVFARHRIDPAKFVMIGNSIKSDALPVLELGGAAIHVPYRTTWALEHAEEPTTHARYRRCEVLADIAPVVEDLIG